jgi:phage baseplate assembly protein W
MSNFVDLLFSDIPSNLDPHPVNRDVTIVKEERAVNTAIRNLILTKAYERPFHPEIGGDVTHYLFENPSVLTEFAIRDRIESTIERFESKRVDLIDVDVSLNHDDNAYVATIRYRLVNRLDPITLSVILKRVR